MRLAHLVTALLLDVALATPAAVAATPTVFKCIAADGATSFQERPCATGERQAWARTVAAAPAPIRAAPSHDRPLAPEKRRSAGVTRQGRVASRAGAPPASRCDAAKARRADLRERHWRTIGFDQLRSLDDEVWRACRQP
jgi:hypothetical protein